MTLSVRDLETKLAEAQRTVASFGGEYAEASLDALNGKPGALNRVSSIEAAHVAAQSNLKQVTAALGVAREQEAIKLAGGRAAVAKAQLAAVRQHLAARDAAATKLSALLEEAGRQWTALLESSGKAQAACPLGKSWPTASLTGLDELKNLAANELFRTAGDGEIGHRLSFPGGKAPSIQLEHDPASVPVMADVVKSASAFVIASLTGKAA